MLFERIEIVYGILINLAGLMFCLFQHIKRPRKLWPYAVVFMLAGLQSNYYWGVYELIMGDFPNVSSLLAYFGWDASFMVLALMLIALMREEKLHFFSPLALLPVPINFWQFMLYTKFGGLFNNIWQCFFSTVTAVLSLNIIIYCLRNRKAHVRPPYVASVCFCYITLEFSMWTISCFDWPSELMNPYNYISVISYLFYILLPWAITRSYRDAKAEERDGSAVGMKRKIIPLCIVVVSVFCVGGYILALWMRDTLSAGIGQVGDKDPYSVIAVMLFGVSGVVVAFSIILLLLISFEQKMAESERFKRAKTEAEQSNAAKSDFLANMSHEIRTPINAVLGMNEMIMNNSLQARDALPEDRETIVRIFSDICNYSGNIYSAGNNLLSIINDILDLSKIEAGKMEIINGEYRLSSVLNDVSNMIMFKAKAKGLKFQIHVKEDLPDVLYGDEVRVRQVVTNLLNNAVKYTHSGGVRLSIHDEEQSDHSDKGMTRLVFTIKDTGIGIKKEDIGKLFNKFQRVDLERNSTVEGTGLGLVITMSLLEMMGGSVSVESEYGKGSTFTAVVPQGVVSNEPIGDFREKFESSINSLKARKESFHAPDADILVVDDTHMNLMVVKGLLKSTQIKIDTAESGRESIEMARNKPYDLILMDQRMPEMEGVTAMQQIKKDKKGKNSKTPFICLTADALTGARDRYIAEGFEDYLTKPVDGRSLESMILKYLPKEKILQGMAENLIDRDAGLVYCGESEEFYNEMLDEFISDSEARIAMIEKYYKEKDWENYAIAVHSLKSNSKMIGATGLSTLALHLEMAAKAENEMEIDDEHEELLEQYRYVLDAIRDFI